MDIKELRSAYNQAVGRMNKAADAIEALADDATEEQVQAADAEFESAKADVERSRRNLTRLEEIAEARTDHPTIEITEEPPIEERHELAATSSSTLGNNIVVYQTPKAQSLRGLTYRPDTWRTHSFFADQLLRREGDEAAKERLRTNRLEAMSHLGLEERDMQNLTTQGAELLPPIYTADLFVEPNIAGRPLADRLPKYPLPPSGTAISTPQLASGVTVAARADAGTVSETDGVTATITHTVNEIAGQVDIGRIAVMRSDPGLDMVIGRTLVRRYNAYLDTQLISGTGTAPQHDGLRNVASANTVAYTDASPTAAELVPKLYDAIQKVASNRLEEQADLIVMHPRRAAFLASNLSSTFPLFQLGGLYQAAGNQSMGFTAGIAGLEVLLDPNVGTLYGAATNEDEIYVLASVDFQLAEGPLMSRVFEDVGSGTGVIRYQVFAHSAFLSNLYPASLTIISGTGLVSPVF